LDSLTRARDVGFSIWAAGMVAERGETRETEVLTTANELSLALPERGRGGRPSVPPTAVASRSGREGPGKTTRLVTGRARLRRNSNESFKLVGEEEKGKIFPEE